MIKVQYAGAFKKENDGSQHDATTQWKKTSHPNREEKMMQDTEKQRAHTHMTPDLFAITLSWPTSTESSGHYRSIIE